MQNLQNLHTHSIFCDGNDTPEEMIKEAINKGFSSIGFSVHAYMSKFPHGNATPDRLPNYKREINSLKEKYNNQIEIFCGIEAETLVPEDLTGYDYIFGAFHYFKFGNEYVGFDRDAKTVQNVIDKYFEGDGLKYAKHYYETISQMPKYIKADVLTHFDLISKHTETSNFFDENSKQYLDYAFDAIDALSGKIPFFEINTGGMARGYKSTPYPSIPILKRLLQKGFLPIVTTDCHNKYDLDFGYDMALDILESVGVKERYILTKDGFKPVNLR